MKTSSVLLLLLGLSTACGQGAQNAPKEAPEHTQVKTIPVGKGPDALFLTPDERFLYVANVEDRFISVIDTRTDKVVQTIDGADYPWGFVRLGESNLVAVSGYDKGVDLIDFTRHQIVKSQRFQHNLGGITATKDGKTLFVVATDANQVLKLDAGTLEVQDRYATGNGPDGVGVSMDGRKLYVTNTKDGTISVIDMESKKTRLLQTGGKPELIHSNEDHSLLFISNFFENKIHVLDTRTDEIVHEITGLDGPEEAVLSKSGDVLFVVNFNSSKIYTYDARTYRKRPEVFTVGTKPIGVVSALHDSKLYVSNYGDNAVGVIALPSAASSEKAAAREAGPELLVRFKSDATEEQIASLASELGLEQVKTIPALNLHVYKVVSGKGLDEVIAACEKQPFVKYAEPNQKVGLQR
ncbi:MAG: YncE family protein [Calditrichaeota bacterium]|nr:MAG: YncE family protein [Calditrichota bacterium]